MKDREDWRLARFQIIGLGVLVNSALYLVLVFVAARTMFARDLAVTAAGVTYLSWLAQSREPVNTAIATALIGASIVLGIAAGLALLIGY